MDWTCPYCNRDATLGGENLHFAETTLWKDNYYGNCRFGYQFEICPNAKCKRFSLKAMLWAGTYVNSGNDWQDKTLIREWNLLPNSNAQTYPSYIPAPIIEDYNEACLIVGLSPKSSATLARRCLQGILRDFWKVPPGNLVKEVEAIKDQVDSTTWKAIEAVRKVGNIGAHMEKDINTIVDVDPQEAQILISLIEVLLKDWYIARHDKESRMSAIIAVADKKEMEKKRFATASAKTS